MVSSGWRSRFPIKGKQPLTIEKITVRIPVAERLTDDLEMLYGGSCMGRTPLLRQNVGSANHEELQPHV